MHEVAEGIPPGSGIATFNGGGPPAGTPAPSYRVEHPVALSEIQKGLAPGVNVTPQAFCRTILVRRDIRQVGCQSGDGIEILPALIVGVSGCGGDHRDGDPGGGAETPTEVPYHVHPSELIEYLLA